MIRHQCSFAIVLAAVCLIRSILTALPGRQLPPESIHRTFKINSEARFALGDKIPFSDAFLYDLELIDGISDAIGTELIEKRSEILKAASGLPEQEKHRSFEIAKGVGKKTALKLNRYLILP